MPACKNDPKARYSGLEPSSKGLGWSAHAEKLGRRRKGRDGVWYMVAPRADGTQFWRKAPTRPARKSSRAQKRQPDVLSWYTVRAPRPRWTKWDAGLPVRARQRLRHLRGPVFKKLRTAGVLAEIVPLPLDAQRGLYWVDLPGDYFRAKHPTADEEGIPYVIAVLCLEADASALRRRYVTFDHAGIKRAVKKTLLPIMREAFDAAFAWDGSYSHGMRLDLA